MCGNLKLNAALSAEGQAPCSLIPRFLPFLAPPQLFAIYRIYSRKIWWGIKFGNLGIFNLINLPKFSAIRYVKGEDSGIKASF